MVTHKFVMQTSRQLKSPLLCFECEQLLRERGEDWVIPQLAQHRARFPFGESLQQLPKLSEDPDLTEYTLAGIHHTQTDQLVHFALGVFWKASVHNWINAKDERPVRLETEDMERLRKFLLGEEKFPPLVALTLSVLPLPGIDISFCVPFETPGISACRTFHWYICGLYFGLWMGPAVPLAIFQGSLNYHPNTVLVYDIREYFAKRQKDAYADAKKSLKLQEYLSRRQVEQP